MRERSDGPARNGIPVPPPYRYRGSDREPGPREVVESLHARVLEDAVRAWASAPRPRPLLRRDRCPECGYLPTALGHAVTCGPPEDIPL